MGKSRLFSVCLVLVISSSIIALAQSNPGDLTNDLTVNILDVPAVTRNRGNTYSASDPLGPPPGPGEQQTLVANLDTVWAIDFLPDGTMIFTERPGRVSVFRNGQRTTVGDISVAEDGGARHESGLMGIAVDPDFNSNRYIYVMYTYFSGSSMYTYFFGSSRRNRVSRFVLDGTTLRSETILINQIPGAKYHDGGRIKFGPDGKLYVAMGDATDPSEAQNLNSLAGKILRLNKDGSVPPDNPFGNYVWSSGHRNPQGLAWHSSGRMYAAEHGPIERDEVNYIVKGGNYGWPETCGNGGRDPIVCYVNPGFPPSGIAIHNNDIYVAGLGEQKVRRIRLDSSLENDASDEVFIDGLGRTRAVVVKDGLLYIGTSNMDGRGSDKSGQDDRILRVRLP